MPSNAQEGNYKVKVEGGLESGAGYAFYNETDIEFDPKQASVFIQLSKPIYRQGQTGTSFFFSFPKQSKGSFMTEKLFFNLWVMVV